MSSDDLTFTGERLHADDALFGVDLLRHRAAYRAALQIAQHEGVESVLEMGSGTGYGTVELAAELPAVTAVDRVAPLSANRNGRARFLCGDLEAMPLREACFDAVVSFQVIEHLDDPTAYLEAIGRLLKPTGVAMITTPNRLNSDGENPFHVREYAPLELQQLLERHFESVDMQGVSARGEALRYHEARLARIRRIVRIDPLGLRRRIPRRLVEWLFARLAVVVRRGIASEGGMPSVTLDDFPIEAAHPGSLDLFAVCRGSRSSQHTYTSDQPQLDRA